jgi:ribonuclease HI
MNKEASRKLDRPQYDSTFNFSIAWSHFNGACHGTPGNCGASIVLHLFPNHIFLLKLGVGHGRNTQDELISLWVLFNFAREKGIWHLQVVGDSKVVIDWFKRKTQLDILVMLPWQRKIQDLKESYDSIIIEHIYREFNQ